VTLTQSGTSVNFVVDLSTGSGGASRFVETGAGAGALFLFNDSIAGSAIINALTVNPANAVTGGLSGLTNQSAQHADGTGDFTATVFCTISANCNGGSTPAFTGLTFTVTNATLAQLETKNASGNFFVADIAISGNGANTGPVDVSVPGPIVGAGLPGLVMACSGLLALVRRRRQRATA
jgi:hypothetical protein